MVQTAYISTVTANTTLSANYDTYTVNATSGNITITLPNITADGLVFNLRRTDTSSNTVTIQGTGGQLINGAATTTMNFKSDLTLHSLTSAWVTNGLVGARGTGGQQQFVFVQNNGNSFIPFASNTTTSICDFIYRGSTFNGGYPSLLAFVFATVNSTSTYTINLVHISGTGVTAGSIIATINVTASVSTVSTQTILSTSSFTVANIAAGNSVWELQVQRTSGTQAINIYSAYLSL